MSEGKGEVQNTARRDTLIALEKKYQKYWADEKFFEIDSPSLSEDPDTDVEKVRERHPKYFATMAYPYMNGILHAGHAFTLSKVEFATGYERMIGRRALFPLGFHCTGMPIKSAADKIKREVELFGEDFSGAPAEDEEKEAEAKPAVAEKVDPTKFKAKKSKAVQKQGRGKFQFEIMLQLGIPVEEVKKFADPDYWLRYFPQLVQKHVTALGGRVDWRRSMVTTPANPFYDAFVRWQINRLRDVGKIKFGERYTIYSEKDGQACLDHDRSSGEGLNPQEYTGIKIVIDELAPEAQKTLEGKFDPKTQKLFLVAATLRPETMYGQTCCFVSPKIEYGVFDAGNGELFITTERAFKNMCYQKLTPKRGYYVPVAKISGSDLIGSKITPPMAVLKNLRVLPMETVLASKGTGVVTCVPSDSPDDYITMRELRNKPEYYKIEKEWVPEEIIPLIETEKYGNKCAEFLVNELKIQSPKDSVQLAKAKELAYKEGFYSGKMIYGNCKGLSVAEAKPKVKEELIAANEAFVYNEPEGLVISRSGDECIVSLEDQWYIDYGEEVWKSQALDCLEHMNTFSKETRHGFEGVLDWLKNWAVTRNFGLGTRLPWDERYLVESLSDSTVYMAYYTIARFLHLDYYGQKPGKFSYKAEEFTDEIFDFIFCRRDDLGGVETSIKKDDLLEMRREFEYFYPLDVRVSGKDLIPNHLTFFIYSHVALFPKKFWPKGIRANGHLLLNNQKMAKLTGNFLTLEQIIEKFGADAARIAMADAGDSIEDANFDELNANAAILRLTTLKEWCEDILSDKYELVTGPLRDNFFDVAFENEMNKLIEITNSNYEMTDYKAALKSGLFDFQIARDFYRDSVGGDAQMHKTLVLRYIEAQVLMLAPVAPHFAEYVYRDLLGKSGSIQTASFPKPLAPVLKATEDALEYVRDLLRSIREAEGNVLKKKKGKPSEVDSSKPAKLTIFVSLSYPEWQTQYLKLVKELFEEDVKNGTSKLGDLKAIKEIVGKDAKRAMPFIALLKQRLIKEDPKLVFEHKFSYNEVEVLELVLPQLKRAPAAVRIEEVQVILFANGEKEGKDIKTGEKVEITVTGKIVESAVPGEPGIMINNL